MKYHKKAGNMMGKSYKRKISFKKHKAKRGEPFYSLLISCKGYLTNCWNDCKKNGKFKEQYKIPGRVC